MLTAHCLILLALAGPVAANGQHLPPIESVRLLREARIAEMKGDTQGAFETLTRAAEAFPYELPPVVALLEHQLRYGGTAEDVARLRAMLTERLADPEREIPQGTLEYLVFSPDSERDELELLLDAVQRRLAAAPDDYELLETQSVLQERLELPDDARATYARMLKIEDAPLTHTRCLAIDRKAERWDEAAGHLEELVRTEFAAGFRMSYVEALGRLGRYEEAVEQLDLLEEELDLTRVLMLNPLKHLLADVGWSLYDQGKTAEAEAMFRRILEVDPENRDARSTILYLYSSEEERAAHEASLAQQWSQETDPHALLAEGGQKLVAGDAAGALPLLERAAAALPDDEIAQYNLGLAATRTEHWEIAEQALGRASRLNPDRVETYLNRGIALYQLGRWENAVAILHLALERQPDLSQCHYYLYMCYRELRDTAAAAKHRALYAEATATGD